MEAVWLKKTPKTLFTCKCTNKMYNAKRTEWTFQSQTIINIVGFFLRSFFPCGETEYVCWIFCWLVSVNFTKCLSACVQIAGLTRLGWDWTSVLRRNTADSKTAPSWFSLFYCVWFFSLGFVAASLLLLFEHIIIHIVNGPIISVSQSLPTTCSNGEEKKCTFNMKKPWAEPGPYCWWLVG